jgi:hypothetical protein
MRFIGKVYVMDVLDAIVVSGYVIEAELDGEEPGETYEFSQTYAGRGDNVAQEWLAYALHQHLLNGRTPPPGGQTTGPTTEGVHSISGSGDSHPIRVR